MAVRSTLKAGNASDTTVWTFGLVPVSGDRIIVNHALTIDANTTIGDSPPIFPATAPTVNVTGGGASGGLLAADTYLMQTRDVDASGNESSSVDEITFTVASGNIPRVTFPALPTGVTSRSIYLCTSSLTSGHETLYASGITATTYDIAAAQTFVTYHYHAAGSGSNTATYTFTGLTPGTFDVTVSWIAAPGRATNAPYTVFDNVTSLGTVKVNMQVSPIGTTSGGLTFQSLGSFTIASSTLKVQLTDNADGFVIGMAARVNGTTVTAGGAGYAEAGTWGTDGSRTAGKVQYPNYGMLINSTGSLTIAANKTLTLRGTGNLINTSMTLSQGATFQFDSTQAVNTANTYKIFTGSTNNQTSTKVVCNGVNGTPCTIQSVAGGGNGYFDSAFRTSSGTFQCTYTNFTRMGDGTNRGIYVSQAPTVLSNFDNCRFDACGALYIRDADATTPIRVTNSTWINSVAAPDWNAVVPNAGVTRTFTGNVFDLQPALQNVLYGGTWTDNVFYNAYSYTTTLGTANLNTRNFIRRYDPVEALSISIPGDCSYNYFMWEDTGGGNPHFTTGDTTKSTITFDHCIWEYTGADGSGDCAYGCTAGTTQTVQYSIVLPNSARQDSGCITNSAQSYTLNVFHNTYCFAGQGALLGDSGASGAGMVANLKGNIGWCDNGFTGYIIQDLTNSPPADPVAPANADYNYLWNPANGTQTGSHLGYNINNSSAPGTHDQKVSGGTGPNFVDSSRNFVNWGRKNGLTGTDAQVIAAALVEMMKRNDTSTQGGNTFNVNFLLGNLFNYIYTGFMPRNSALKGAAHDGMDIGAVSVGPTIYGATSITNFSSHTF